jgi:hypothetical protein
MLAVEVAVLPLDLPLELVGLVVVATEVLETTQRMFLVTTEEQIWEVEAAVRLE